MQSREIEGVTRRLQTPGQDFDGASHHGEGRHEDGALGVDGPGVIGVLGRRVEERVDVVDHAQQEVVRDHEDTSDVGTILG